MIYQRTSIKEFASSTIKFIFYLLYQACVSIWHQTCEAFKIHQKNLHKRICKFTLIDFSIQRVDLITGKYKTGKYKTCENFILENLIFTKKKKKKKIPREKFSNLIVHPFLLLLIFFTIVKSNTEWWVNCRKSLKKPRDRSFRRNFFFFDVEHHEQQFWPFLFLSKLRTRTRWRGRVRGIHADLHRIVSFRNATEFPVHIATLSHGRRERWMGGLRAAANLCRRKCFIRTNSSMVHGILLDTNDPWIPRIWMRPRFAGISTGIALSFDHQSCYSLIAGRFQNCCRALRSAYVHTLINNCLIYTPRCNGRTRHRCWLCFLNTP